MKLILKFKGEKRTTKYHIPAGATLFITDGMEVAKGFKMAEHAPSSVGDSSRLTEKATKDITSDISGEVVLKTSKLMKRKTDKVTFQEQLTNKVLFGY